MNWEERSVELLIAEGKRWDATKKWGKRTAGIAALMGGTMLGADALKTASHDNVASETCPTCGKSVTKKALKGAHGSREAHPGVNAGEAIRAMGARRDKK